MKCFAEHGTEAASLRMIAHAAGVSVGLLQHRFITKAALIEAVDDELLAILRRAALAATPPVDPATDLARWLAEVATKRPEALDYLLQLLISDSATGRRIFNQLAGVGTAHWDRRHDGAESGSDSAWAALHPLLLTFGTLILRPHVERHLLQPVDIAGQLAAVVDLLHPRPGARAARDDGSQ